MEKEERLRILTEIAEMYYIEGKTQSQIAQVMNFSRSAVSRMLTEARLEGIVEVKINHPLDRSYALERRLMDNFDLSCVMVLNRGVLDDPLVLRQLGRLGAIYLEENMPVEGILGISWGRSSYEVANAIRPHNYEDLTIVQLIGAIGSGDPHIDGNELVRNLAQTLGARYRLLNSPLIVDDEQTCKSLLNERNIRETINLAMRSDLALVGIGSSSPDISSLYRAGYISTSEISHITKLGIVGDMCAMHYDIQGNIPDIDLNSRVIGVNLLELAQSPCKILGIAGGRKKAPAILGALRGNFVDILVIDSPAAEEIFSLDLKTSEKK